MTRLVDLSMPVHKDMLTFPRVPPPTLVLYESWEEFAERIGKSFLYFQDQPMDHWWPGDGIGAAFVPGVKTFFPDHK